MSKSYAYARIVAVTLALTFSTALSALSQELPTFVGGFTGVPNRSIDFNTFLKGAWLSDLGFGRASAGIFLGGGTLRVSHTIEAGPGHVAAIPGLPDFDYFVHVRETPLKDAFLSLDGSLTAQGFDFLKVRVETNVGTVTQFRQWTEPGVQQPYGWYARYAVGSVLQLPNDQEGVIYLDNRNRIQTWDVIGRIPGLWGVDVLLEYKHSTIKSFLDPYSMDFPPLGRQVLSPNVGWRNNWRNAVPFTTSFNMGQTFKWWGPFVGLSWRNPFSTWGGEGYLDFVASPLLFATYEFYWGAAYDDGFFFVRGFQGTRMAGWDRIGLELRGGATLSLSGSVTLGASGKYTYVRLVGSDIEYQSMSNNFLATTDYVQGAQEYVTLNQHFWQLGGIATWAF